MKFSFFRNIDRTRICTLWRNFSSGRGGTLLRVFFAYIIFLVACTIGYKEIPLVLHYSLLGEESFYSGLITNLFSSAVDFLVFSIVIYFLLAKHEVSEKISLYKDNIDDSRFLYTDEAAFRNSANIRRLQRLNVKTLDLSKCTLKGVKLKGLSLADSLLMGACLDLTNLEHATFKDVNLKGASAQNSNMSNTQFEKCVLKNFDFRWGKMLSANVIDSDLTLCNFANANLRASRFVNCNFSKAILKDCNMDRVDLRGAINLTVDQLLECSSIKYALLDKSLEELIPPARLGRNKPQSPKAPR